MSDLSKEAVIRIAKKAGAERVGDDAAVILVELAEKFISDLSKRTFELAKHDNRKTIKKIDIEFLMK